MSKVKVSIGLALVAAIVGLGAASIALAHPQSAAKTTVRVSATEFKFKLSRSSAPHGVVAFVVKNNGKIAHDFKIAGHKTAKLSPGKSQTLRVTLTKGRHPYICTVDSHAKFGMKGTFRAT
jgi:uncharacterized cupredoxin-like copper-binding protein